MEMATLLAAAGSQVSIVEFLSRPMMAFSEKHVMNTVEEMKKRGIRFYFNQGLRKTMISLKLLLQLGQS